MHETQTKAGLSVHPLLHLHAASATRYVDSESAIAIFSAALHARGICTHSHCQRVIHYALTLGRLVGLSMKDLRTLERGVFLHDAGKIYVPDSVLRKPGHLTERERLVMQQHAAVGYEMVSAFAALTDVADIVLVSKDPEDLRRVNIHLAGVTGQLTSELRPPDDFVPIEWMDAEETETGAKQSVTTMGSSDTARPGPDFSEPEEMIRDTSTTKTNEIGRAHV